MGETEKISKDLSELAKQMENTGIAVAAATAQQAETGEAEKELENFLENFCEEVITPELSDKLNAYVQTAFKKDLEAFIGDESAFRQFKESLFTRAFRDLGLMELADKEMDCAGLMDVHHQLEEMERMNKKVEHMFNDCNTLMEAIEANLSTLQSRLPGGHIVYVPYSSETNPIVLDDDDKVDLDDDEDVVAISPEENARSGEAGFGETTEKAARKILNPQEVMEEVAVAEGAQILARRGEVWHSGRLVDLLAPGPDLTSASGAPGGRRYRVRFLGSGAGGTRVVMGSEIAFRVSAASRNEVYPVGTRVVSVYRDDEGTEDFYSGIVAEPPSERNSKRYLLFFDDGYTQYSKEEEIFRIFLQTTRNWMELSEDSQEFVKKYLENYPNRPMVRLKANMTVRTELNCRWLPASVEEVDASLVLIRFNSDNHREWIYRGSTRLEPLYSEIRKTLTAQKSKPHAQRKLDSGASNKPVVEYLHDKSKLQRPTARKSTMQASNNLIRRPMPGFATHMERETNVYVQDNMAEDMENRGSIVSTVVSKPPLKVFTPHDCSPACLGPKKDSRDTYKGWNPLEIPILWKWERSRLRSYPRFGYKDNIVYVAPCGRRLRNIVEVDRYLEETNSNLTVDLFCFDSSIRVNAEFKVYRAFTNIADLSYGAENVPVPCVNSIDNEVPPYVDYHKERIARHTPLCEDKDFLPGCDCVDNCRDKSKCSCRQLSITMSACRRGGLVDMRAGYSNRRLQHHYVTGVFECNSTCGCDSRCHNRVVQNGLWAKLQIFKTEKKGWGIRTLHDIPRGMFICIYAGMMYGEQLAVDEGNEFGDEYQADLDYIECVENGKEGYESDVDEPSDIEDNGNSNNISSNSSNSAEESDSGAEADFRLGSSKGSGERRTLPSRSTKQSQQQRSRSNERKKDEEQQRVTKNAGRAYIGRLVPSPTKSCGQERSAEVIVISDEEEMAAQPSKSDELSETPADNGDNKEKKRTGGRRSTRGGLNTSVGTKCPSPSSDRSVTKYKPLRELYGDGHTQPYIMDAKKAGNLGRYMNHACSPNAFVQNVFINTHDARFPEVAFFACKNIMAGEELTWDYQYHVGSVPNKELYCYCGTSECRGRLL